MKGYDYSILSPVLTYVGSYIWTCQSPEYLIEENPTFFDQFTMVIATSLNDSLALKLAAICQASNTPLFLVKCLGFTGMFRIQAGEHTSE
jgi:amyloid beta precursor protein binding protein 1